MADRHGRNPQQDKKRALHLLEFLVAEHGIKIVNEGAEKIFGLEVCEQVRRRHAMNARGALGRS